MDEARFVLSRSKALERYEYLKGLCPSISYSMKTNPQVGRLLEEETGCTFGVHTAEGLSDIKDVTRAYFMVEAGSRDSLRGLIREGVAGFIAHTEGDLASLLSAARAEDARIRLFLRMRFHETTVYRGRFFLYGMEARTIARLAPGLRKNPLVSSLGLHFHRKTQNTGNWNMKDMLEDMLPRETMRQFEVVNIGGGIPVDYKNSRASNIGYIEGKIRELRGWLSSMGMGMTMEPGRSLAAPAVKLDAGILSVQGRHVTLNCSVYNTAMDTIIFPLKLIIEGEGEGQPYVIKGCTPDSMDIFRYEAILKDPEPGQRLVFLNAGAYNFSSDFCNLEKPDTVIVQ